MKNKIERETYEKNYQEKISEKLSTKYTRKIIISKKYEQKKSETNARSRIDTPFLSQIV